MRKRFWIPALLAALAGCGDSRNRSGQPKSSGGESEPTRKADKTEGVKKIAVISKGEAYRQEDYIIPGYVTILEFTADW